MDTFKRPEPAHPPRGWVPPWRTPGDTQGLREHLRAIFRDYAINSPIVLFISIYIYWNYDEPNPWPLLEPWLAAWCAYLLTRLIIGLVHARVGIGDDLSMGRWSRLSLMLQAIDSLFLSLLALFIYPTLDPMTQMAVLTASLILVGASAFSLSWRRLSVLVYAPSIYFSFAWSTWNQSHPYAKGFAVFVLAMFALYILYASNQRKSVNKGFELAKRNGELAQELQVKNDELQQVAKARSRLLATVSHDLRQPAHAIGLLAERARLDPSAPSLAHTLRNLDELAQSLSASLTTLMDLTRLDAGLIKATLVPVHLGQEFLRLEAEYSASAKNKGLSLKVASTDLWVTSDPVLLHGVLANLVSNAIKYTRVGRVDVELAVHAHEALVTVGDTGPGIHADKLELSFREFVRLEGAESGTEGLGLGLSIVRRYAALMHHALSVQSIPGQGSRFSLSLSLASVSPAQAQGHAVAHAASGQDERLAGLRVLVVDNVDLVLSSMVKTLSAWGCQVHAGRSLTQARLLAQTNALDLIISDFHLGDDEPNGLMLIKALRQIHPSAPQPLPALLMTGDVSNLLEAEAAAIGAGVLHKPVRPAVLQRAVLQQLSSQPMAS